MGESVVRRPLLPPLNAWHLAEMRRQADEQGWVLEDVHYSFVPADRLGRQVLSAAIACRHRVRGRGDADLGFKDEWERVDGWLSAAEAGRVWGVSVRQVESGKRLLRSGDDELVRRVWDGEVSVSAAIKELGR